MHVVRNDVKQFDAYFRAITGGSASACRTVLAQGGKGGLQRLRAGVDGELGLRVERGAPGQDALEVFHRLAAGGHGPQVALGRTRPCGLRVGLQPHRGAVGQQLVEGGRVGHQPPGVAITASG
jgi:hypothetical protein